MTDINIERITTILTYLCVFIIAGSIHEFAHAWSAYALGDPTAKDNGRMTTNPLAHIDLIGSILFPIIGIGIGWMKPVPVFLPNLVKPIRDHAIIAFAGPFSNFVQACFAILITKIIFYSFGNHETLFYILQIYAYINIILMGFNLIPFPPLDGGAILRYFLPSSLHHIFDYFGRFSFVILIILLISGALTSLLIPFRILFELMMSTDLILLLPLNLANIFIISYFFKTSIRKKLYPKQRKTTKTINPTNITTDHNTKYIEQARNIKSMLKEKGIIDNSITEEIDELKTKLDKQANICPPTDYNIDDSTCKSCEWFKNCLVRYADENIGG